VETAERAAENGRAKPGTFSRETARPGRLGGGKKERPVDGLRETLRAVRAEFERKLAECDQALAALDLVEKLAGETCA